MITPADMKYLKEKKAYKLKKEYAAKLNEDPPELNYADFHKVGDKLAAQFYIEALKKSIETGVPFESKYDPKEPLY